MNEYISKIIASKFTIPTAVGFTSFLGGGAVGYILGRKKQTNDYYEIPDPQLSFMFDEVHDEEVVVRRQPFVVDADVLAKKGETFVIEQLAQEEVVEETTELVRHSVFAGDDVDWDYEKETATRTTTTPYILHRDEFFAEENSKDYAQLSLTYYAGDDILCDEEDKPIYNHSTIVGELKFGHGSSDPNAVYIRNDKLHAEYEIVLNPGLFSVEVMGLEIEDNERAKDLKHSSRPGRFPRE